MSGDDEPLEGEIVGGEPVDRKQTDPVRAEVEAGLVRCRRALVFDAGEGAAVMEASRREFTRLWTETLRNIAQAHGRTAVEEVLEAMGRSEDSAKLY